MKNTFKTTKSKEERLLINNQKCMLALGKGYKYDKATGEIIGQKGRAIKAHINGYTIISFVINGVTLYIYGTTFIAYILKSENPTISNQEIELAKVYVKPSATYLANRKALKESNGQEVFAENDLKGALLVASQKETMEKAYFPQSNDSLIGQYYKGNQLTSNNYLST